MPLPDPFADVLAQQAYGPIYSAQYQDAHKSARANELAHRLGIPPDIVESDIPNMMATDRMNRAIANAQRNAAYARIMSNTRLAAAGIDDPHLPAVAQAADDHRNFLDFNAVRRSAGPMLSSQATLLAGAAALGGRLVSGVADIFGGLSGVAHGASEIADSNGLPPDLGLGPVLGALPLAIRLFGAAHDKITAVGDATRYETSNRNFNDVLSGVESIPTVATAVAGPEVPTALFAAEGFSNAYDEGRKAGLSPNRAGMYGVGDAAIMAGTSFLPEKYLGGVLSGKGGIAKTLGAGVGLNEVMTVLQGLNHWYFIDRPKGVTFDQFVGTLPDQMRSSFVSTLTALGLTVGAGHVASRIVNRATDTQAAQSVENVMEAAAKSETRKANPTHFEAALNQLVGDSNASDLYVPADKVLELFQPQEGKAERDIHSDPFWSQYAGQVEEAGTLGGDVVIPLSSAATHLAGSPDWAAIRDYVRSRPGGASLAEIKSAQSPEELEALASHVAERIDQAVPQLKAQQLTQEFAAKLGYKGEQADAISQLLGAGLARAYALENARRAARGEAPVPIEQFAANWLPSAEKTTQAEFDAEAKGTPAKAATGTFERATDALAFKPKGTDVITFVRRLGGVRDDEGHDLARSRGYLKRPGLINKRGRSIDSIGEALWEAGYFGAGAERPTEAEVLDLLERGFNQKTYAPHDTPVENRFANSESEDSARERIRDAAKENEWPLAPADEDLALSYMADGYTPKEAAFAAFEHSLIHGTADLLDEIAAEGVKGHDYEGAADRLRASAEGSAGRSEQGTGDENYVPGFDEARDAGLERRRLGSDFNQILNQLFGEPDQPKRTMTQAQRAELEARLMQSMMRRGGQESVKDQKGGLFSSERDQDTLFQGARPEDEKAQGERKGLPPMKPEMLRRILKGGAALGDNGEVLSDTQRRGNISIARDEQGLMENAVIRAFEASDFSTGIHEIGHFFLEDLKRRALGQGATEAEKADWQAVKDWMSENGHAVGDDNAIPEPGHETFARGFERYIYEGKAPSQGLKAVFAKMRDFMVSLYRSIRSFNAPITPEIRNVMDRLLASDDEIAARREQLRLGDETLSELMTGEEQQRYVALGDEARDQARDTMFDRVLSTIRAQRTRDVARRKSEIRQEIGDQTDRQPIFRALKMLRSGVPQEDGSTARATLPRDWLVENYGEGILDKLPKGVPPIYDEAHGVDPEGLARDAGFESADQMVQKLIAHEEERQALKASGDTRSPRRSLVETMTDEKLKSELGDPFENLEEEADAAIANERQADRLSLELRALSRKTGKAPVPWKMAKDWARAHIRSASSKEAISGAAIQMYSKAAAKAAQNVEEALVGKDYEAAFRAKQQQVLNLALMGQAKEAKDEVLSAVKRLRRVAKAKNIPSVEQDYLDQAHRLLENVDMKSRPAKAVDKRMAFEAWHQRQVEMDIDPVVPPEYQSVLGQTHWSRLSINDLLELDSAVKQIVKLGRLKQELKDGQKKRAFAEAVSEMQDSGGRIPPRKARGGTTDPRKTSIGRAASWLRTADAYMLKTEQLAIWLDRNDPNGPWQRYLYRPFAEAQGRKSDLMRQYGHDLNALIDAMPKEAIRSLTRSVDTPELVIRNGNHLSNGEAFKGTKDQVLMMALNWGNLGNRQRLLDGFGWSEDAVASVFDRVLTKDDWDFVQGVWDTVDKLWPDVAKLERDVNGAEPEKVEASEIETPHGTYRGGYFPIVYDPMQTTHTAQVAEDKIAPSGGWWTITTRSSATKERAEQVKGRPLLLSLSVITHHMNEVIHDLTHRQAVSQAKRLLGDERVAATINRAMGPEYLKAARQWVERVAKPNSAYSRANPAEVAIARYLNKAITTIGLGFRVTVSFKQLLGIPFSAKELGSDAIAKGMAIVTAHPVQAYKEMLEKSSEMRARSDALDASIEDMHSDLASGKLKHIGPRGITKYAFQGIVWMDVVSRTTVWTSAYNKALEQGMSEEDAIAYGDRSVRQSHGIGFQKDRAALQSGHPFARAMWPFFSYMNALYNAQRDIGHRVARAETAADYGEAARRAWWVFVVPALLQGVFFGEGPQDKDGKGVRVGDWMDYLGKQAILSNVESLPLVNNFATAIGHGYSYRAISYQQIGEDIIKAMNRDAKIARGGSEITGSAVRGTLEAVGAITAKPLGQIGATAGGIYDYATGAADPKSVGDWYYLLTRGSIPKQPTAAQRLAGRQ